MKPKAKHDPPMPPHRADPDAIAHDQLRDAPDGVERSGKSDLGMRQPHERDESPDQRDAGRPQNDESRATIEQARRDVERGLVDTDRRGTPSDVPVRPSRSGTDRE
jgi:hypothetical protein